MSSLLKIVLLALMLIVGAGLGPCAKADSILVGTSLITSVSGGVSVGSFQYIAADFSFPLAVDASNVSIVLGVGGFPLVTSPGTGTFLLQMTNALGAAATSGNVLAQSTFTVTVSPTSVGQVFTMPVNQTLQAGTYFLVVSSQDPPVAPGSAQFFWPFSSALPGTVGSASNGFFVTPVCTTACVGQNITFPPGSTWTFQGQSTPLTFQVTGTPVPEPSTLFLVGMGLGGVWLRRKKRTG